MRRFRRITLAVSVFVLLFLLFLVPWAAPFAIRAYVAYAEWSFVRPSALVETSFALPDGGIVRVTGTEIARVVLRITLESPHPFRTYVWHARYQPASSTADEFVGTWQGRTGVTRGSTAGGPYPTLRARFFLRLSRNCEQFTLERTQP
jgi:hypothetical protein